MPGAPMPGAPMPGAPVPGGYPPVVLDTAMPPEPGKRRLRTPILIAAATVVALVLGATAYAGVRLWYGTGAQPEDAAPSTVAAFVRLDLSPGYGQRLKINNLLKKFPSKDGKDTVDQMKTGIFSAFDISESEYRTAIEPWFAERIGVGLWLDNEDPYALAVVASGDDAKATLGLTELRKKRDEGEIGFVVRDGHAIVAIGEDDAQAAAEAAAKEAEQETLADAAGFRRGVEWLPGQQTALVWADLDRIADLVKAAASPALEIFGGAPGFDEANLKGQMIAGVQATGDGVDLRFRIFGAGVAEAGDVRSTVDALPGDSVIAGALRIGDIKPLLGGLTGAGPDIGEFPEELLEGMSPEEAKELREEMMKAGGRSNALGKVLSSLSEAQIAISIAKIEKDVPALAATVKTASAENATALADALKLLDLTGASVSANGSTVEIKTKGYAGGGGNLAGQALYRDALAGAPAKASTVVFADVQRLLDEAKLPADERAEFAPLKAVGIVVGAEDGDPVGQVRVLIR
jgi:hypothetical protein